MSAVLIDDVGAKPSRFLIAQAQSVRSSQSFPSDASDMHFPNSRSAESDIRAPAGLLSMAVPAIADMTTTPGRHPRPATSSKTLLIASAVIGMVSLMI